jgi:hypothetical protein
MTANREFTLIRHFDVPSAEELARLGGIRHDLQRVLDFCAVLEAQSPAPMSNEPVQPFLVWEALSTACVVAYARCFASGVRRPLDRNFLDAAPAHLQKAHTYFLSVRNKHVAHSVNSFEDNTVMLEFGMRGTVPQKVVGATTRSNRLTPIGETEIPQMRELVCWLEDQITPLYSEQMKRVLEVAEKLSPVELIDLGIAPRRTFFQHTKLLTRPRKIQ